MGIGFGRSLMEKQHCIESAIFKISYSSEELALSQHSELEAFAKNELLPIVDEAFSEISGTDSVLWFERLEVDLGEISLSYFYQDFSAKLREKIREALQIELKQHEYMPSDNHQEKSTEVSELDTICEFLAKGSLPWNAALANRQQIDELMIRVLSHSGNEFIANIRSSRDRNSMTSRLAAQFSPETLGQVLRLVTSLKADYATELVSTILSCSISSYGLSRSDTERRIWAEVLQFALLDRSGRMGSKELLGEVLGKLSMLVPHRYPIFVNTVLQSLGRDSANGHIYSAVLEHAQKTINTDVLVQEREEYDQQRGFFSDEEDRAKQEQRSRLLACKARLIEALNNGSVVKLQGVWLELLSQHSEMLREVIISLGQSAQVRRNIARKFHESMIRDIVVLLEPTNHQFIEQLVNDPHLYLESHEEIRMEVSEAKKSLWEFTLTYLLVERGSRFNKKSYIASVMSKLAAHVNVDILDLYESIMALLEPLAQNDPMRAELLGLLFELRSEIGGEDIGLGDRSRVASDRSKTFSGGVSEDDRLPGAQRSNKGKFADSFLEKANSDTQGKAWRTSLENDELPSSPANQQESIDSINPSESMVNALHAALRNNDLAELKLIWKVLTSRHTQWLAEVFKSEGRDEKIRKNVAKSFTSPMFRDVIFVLEPVHGEFVAEVVQSSSRKPVFEGRRPPAPEKTRRTVREFTLSYLIVDRGSRFNKKTYLAALLKRMASHENESVEKIYLNIKKSVESVAKANSYQKELVQLLAEAAEELRIQSKIDAGENRPVIETSPENNLRIAKSVEPGQQRRKSIDGDKELEQLEHIRSYLLYEKLIAAITSARSSGASISYHVIRLLHEMIHNYPWMLHRFNQEVNAGQLSISPVIAQLPRSLQRKLLISFFGSFANRYSFGTQEFETRLTALEDNSRITNTFYSEILQRLIGNRVQELSAILNPEQTTDFYRVNEEELTQPQQQKPNDSAKLDRTAADSKLRESTPLSLNQGTTDLIRAYLMGNLNVIEQDKLAIVSTIELLLSSHPATLSRLLSESLHDKSSTDRLVEIVPESLLVKLMLLMRPDDQHRAILYAELMTMAAIEAEGVAGQVSRNLHLAKWQFVFNYMIIEGKRFSEVAFVRRYAEYIQQRSTAKSSGEFIKGLSDSLSSTSSSRTHVANVRIAMILQSASSISKSEMISEQEKFLARESSKEKSESTSTPETEHQSMDPAEEFMQEIARRQREEEAVEDSLLSGDTRSSNQTLSDLVDSHEGKELIAENSASSKLDYYDSEDDSDVLEDVYINNAGLVLLAPYLPRYFDMLGLMDGKEFKDLVAAERGVHLLQYLVNESTDSFEYQLVLNKLLCGVGTGVPICKSIEISDQEKEASESLLQGIIANWPVLKNTSVEGLRESFMQREAHLQLKADAWHLLVQTKAFDMLLDSLPWGYSTIKLAWMKNPIYVEWR